MGAKGEETRERILEASEALILARGFVGASLGDILAATGLTKGAFFNHFRSKADLAEAVARRYWRRDEALFERFAEAAAAEADDPLDEALAFLRRFEDHIAGLDHPLPGCIFGAYVYEVHQFDPALMDFVREGFERWSRFYEVRFGKVLERYPPRRPTSARALAEMITAIIQGGFILSRSYHDQTFIARQSAEFRNYLELLFRPDLSLSLPAGPSVAA